MAIAKRSNPVEGHTGSGNSQATGAFATNPVSGDTIVVFYGVGGTDTHQAPTDSASNTYTQIGTTQDTTGTFHTQMSVWKSENITGGSSFTVTGHLLGGHAFTVIAWCLSGAATPSSYNADTVGAVNAGSANPASGTSTPAPAANSFFIAGACTEDGNNACTAGSGWEFVTGSTQTDDTTFQDLYTEELTGTNVSSSAQNGQFTASSTAWAARVASFAPAAGAAITPVGSFPRMLHPGKGIFRQARHRSTFPGIKLGGNAYTLALDPGVYNLTGQTATLVATRKLSAIGGTYNVTGSTAGLAKGYKVAAGIGTYNITGQTAALTATRKLTLASGSYVISGSNAGLARGLKLSAASGTYVINGQTVTLVATRKLALASGTYNINGSTATLGVGHKLIAASGSYIINGIDATLTRSSHAYTLVADSGLYVISGGTASLQATRKMTASKGTYVLTGSSIRVVLNLLDSSGASISSTGGGVPQIIND